MEQNIEKKEPLFKELNVDEGVPEVTEVESLCIECEEAGTTKLLLTKIPFFKDIILSSFECEHCGNKNNDIQPTEAFQNKGIKITTKVRNKKLLKNAAKYCIEEILHLSEALRASKAGKTVNDI